MTKKARQASQSTMNHIEYINLLKSYGYRYYHRFWSDTKIGITHVLVNADAPLAVNDMVEQTNIHYAATQSAIYSLKRTGLVVEAGKKKNTVKGSHSSTYQKRVKCYKKTDDLVKLWLFFQSQQAIKKENIEKRVKPLRNDVSKIYSQLKRRTVNDSHEVVRIPCIDDQHHLPASLLPKDLMILSKKVMDKHRKLYTFHSPNSNSLSSYFTYMLHHENDPLHFVSDGVYMKAHALAHHCTFEKRSFYHVLRSPVGDFNLSPLRWRNLKAICHRYVTQQAMQSLKQKAQQAMVVAA